MQWTEEFPAEGKRMAWTPDLSYEEFLSLAKTLGLNVEEPHRKELFTYIQEVFPGLRKIEELDLSDLEPMTSTYPLYRSKGEKGEREP